MAFGIGAQSVSPEPAAASTLSPVCSMAWINTQVKTHPGVKKHAKTAHVREYQQWRHAHIFLS